MCNLGDCHKNNLYQLLIQTVALGVCRASLLCQYFPALYGNHKKFVEVEVVLRTLSCPKEFDFSIYHQAQYYEVF